ncbi:hypothetical protein K0M31_009416 [Melipona bicolor]|uniref:Peptidase S1 domain-containing protein n=1 Tax=Melipona bicolor TaxID=60889 RepID=A0AA40FNN8_9HYME|nr:hypothetical protein K0M31_009416 [Melipona bicolor]
MSLKVVILVALLAATVSAKPYRGYVVPLFDSRIIAGHESNPGQYPWQVSLQWGISSFDYSHFCSGAILNTQWIITAGHCVLAIPAYGDFVVKVGKHNLRTVETNAQTVRVAKSIIHEKYVGDIAPYDIALLKLATPLRLNSAVKAIDLPQSLVVKNKTVILTGWASTSKAITPVLPDRLQVAELPIVDYQTCKQSIDSLTGPSPVDSTTICTGPLTDSLSACSSDSGSPLVANATSTLPQLVGIYTWGLIPCGTVAAPSVYTNVYFFVNWINNTMATN